MQTNSVELLFDVTDSSPHSPDQGKVVQASSMVFVLELALSAGALSGLCNTVSVFYVPVKVSWKICFGGCENAHKSV
jgi:hypothetical protein